MGHISPEKRKHGEKTIAGSRRLAGDCHVLVWWGLTRDRQLSPSSRSPPGSVSVVWVTDTPVKTIVKLKFLILFLQILFQRKVIKTRYLSTKKGFKIFKEWKFFDWSGGDRWNIENIFKLYVLCWGIIIKTDIIRSILFWIIKIPQAPLDLIYFLDLGMGILAFV